MSDERRARVEQISSQAAELPPEERAGFLDETCAEEPSLRSEVELSLGGQVAPPSSERVIARLQDRIGRESRYQVLGEFARGGMGAILRVWDRDLRRTLAMKVVLGQGDAVPGGGTPAIDEKTLGRFLEEAQVTGQLDHPGIVPVHELGLDAQRQVYFTMKLVKGRDLKAIFDLVRAEEEGWTRTRALSVILKVCEAMAYAHSKKVIHRDLKPANVMVGRFGEVYVMDWGLAHVVGQEDKKDIRLQQLSERSLTRVHTDRREESGVDSPLLTMDGDVVGTPAYMSPEQARGDIAAMGPASDVYSLGAILYQLLAGHMPYVPPNAKMNAYALWALVQQGPPPPIAQLAPDAPEELVAICEMAMARESAARYPDMGAMAEDLHAFVEGRVVKAHRTGALVELEKWVSRNKGIAVALAAVFLLAVCGAGVVSWQNRQLDDRNESLVQTSAQLLVTRNDLERRNTALEEVQGQLRSQNLVLDDARQIAERGEREARRQRDEIRQLSYVDHVLLAKTAIDRAQRDEALRQLELCPPELRSWEWNHLKLRLDQGQEVLAPGDPGLGEHLEFLSSTVSLQLSGLFGYVEPRDWVNVPGGHLRLAQRVQFYCQAFTPDRSRLVTGGEGGVSWIWDGRTGALIHTLPGHGDKVDVVAITPDGASVVTGSRDETLRVWDGATGALLAELADRSGSITCVAITADGRMVFSGSWQGGLKAWDVKSGQSLSVAREDPGPELLTLDASNSHLASVWKNGHEIRVFRLPTGHELGDFDDQHLRPARLLVSAEVIDLAFLPDGRLLAAGTDGRVQVQEPWRGWVPTTLGVSGGTVSSLAVDPRGRFYVSVGGADDLVHRWDASTGEDRPLPPVAGEEFQQLAVTADGESVLARTRSGNLVGWDASTRARIPEAELPVLGNLGAWLEGHAVDLVIQDELLVLSDVDSGEELAWIECEEELAAAVLSADGSRLATVTRAAERSGYFEMFRDAGMRSPRNMIGTGFGSDDTLRVWEVDSGAVISEMRGHHGQIECLAISPDGRRLASGGSDHTLRIWDVETGGLLSTLEGELSVRAVAFDTEGKRIVMGEFGGEIQVWESDLETASSLWKAQFDRGLAEARVDASFAELLVEEDVLARLQADPDMTPAMLEFTTRIARRRGASPSWLNGLVWKVVRDPGRSQELYDRAARTAEVVSRTRPSDINYRHTLGVALYRAGHHAEAVQELEAADTMNRQSPSPRSRAWELVFLAMAHHQLGNEAQAREFLQETQGQPGAALDEELARTLREAEALIAPD